MSRVHIVGGGISALSAAVELAPQVEVHLYESAAVFGGRARSFYDSHLNAFIDNGNHLFLSGNTYLLRYLELIDAKKTLYNSGKPFFPFYDLKKRKSWTLSLSSGLFPFWLFKPSCRPPEMRMGELRAFLNFLKAGSKTTVSECLLQGGLTDLLLKPLAISALNTPLNQASAALFGNIIRESLLKGGRGCQPLYPKKSLSDTFIDPALAYLESFKATFSTNTRIKEILHQDGRVTGLKTAKEDILPVAAGESVILATPSAVTKSLLPEIEVPEAHEGILNLHFALPSKIVLKNPLSKSGFLGINGGISEWIFVRDNIISVTVSAASRYEAVDREKVVRRIWQEIFIALRGMTDTVLPKDTLPPYRFIYEKRATFAATPSQNLKRPGTITPFLNLVLAGDWIATSLPSTLEGSVRSGLAAVGELGYRSAIAQAYPPAALA